MKKVIMLVNTHLKKYRREKSILMGVFLFPLVFVGVFGIAFQQGAPGTTTNSLGIVMMDEGIPDNILAYGVDGPVTGNYYSDIYIDQLSKLTFEDNSTHIFEVTKLSEEEGLSLLDSRDIIGLLYIDKDFSLGMLAAIRATGQTSMQTLTNNWENYPLGDFRTKITLKGDQSLQDFAVTSSVIQGFTTTFFNLGEDASYGNDLLIASNIETTGLTTFDYVLPGLVVFGILLNIVAVSQMALRDVESGVLERLRIMKVTGLDYTLSIIASQMLISLVQIPILFGAGILFGFPVSGQIAIAFLFAVLLSLSVTGIGLMVAGIVKNTEAANSVTNMIATPMAFLSSAFFIVPNPKIFNLGENPFRLFDFLPSNLSIEAMRLILLQGYSVSDLIFQLVLIIILSVLYLTLGIIIYSRKHIRMH